MCTCAATISGGKWSILKCLGLVLGPDYSKAVWLERQIEYPVAFVHLFHSYVASVALQSIIQEPEECGDFEVFPHLDPLNLDLILGCSELHESLDSLHDDFSHVFKRSFGRTIREGDKVETRLCYSLSSRKRLELLKVLVQVLFQSIFCRCVAIWDDASAESGNVLRARGILFDPFLIEEMYLKSPSSNHDNVAASDQCENGIILSCRIYTG